MTSRYASRKFLIAIAALVCAQWSLIELLISGEQYKVIVIGVLGLYGLANVAQKAVVK